MGLIDCFKRPLLVERRDDCWRVIMIRIGFLGMIGSLAWIIYLNQETFWNICQSIYQMFIDIIEFGNDKISNHHKGTSISIVNKHDNYMKNLLNEDLDE